MENGIHTSVDVTMTCQHSDVGCCLVVHLNISSGPPWMPLTVNIQHSVNGYLGIDCHSIQLTKVCTEIFCAHVTTVCLYANLCSPTTPEYSKAKAEQRSISVWEK